MSKKISLLIAALVLLTVAMNVQLVISAPQKGDFFHYSESITVNNGTVYYEGYTELDTITGSEQVNSLNGSLISSSYSYSFNWSDNQGSSTSGSSSGSYTWSDESYQYVNGTDNQQGYNAPTHVWFALNTSLPVGSAFYLLNTQMTVLSKNYSFFIPTQNKSVETIETEGAGSYYGSPQDDAYGKFIAHYTWKEYFDPTSGYVVGYNYVEQDTNSSFDSFTYTDNLYVTSTSYALTFSAPAAATSSSLSILSGVFLLYLVLTAVAVIIILAIVASVLMRRRRKEKLPQHSRIPPYVPPAPRTSEDTGIHLTSSEPSQVVEKQTVTYQCPFCKTLYDINRTTCPQCGAPRT